MLINLQPYAQPIRVEVHLGDDVREVGFVLESEAKCTDQRSALREVEEAVGNGFFALRRETHWNLETLYRNLDDWRDFLARPSHGGIEADEERIHEALTRSQGSVLTTENDVARLYERLDGP